MKGDYEKRKRCFEEGRAGLKDTRDEKAECGQGNGRGESEEDGLKQIVFENATMKLSAVYADFRKRKH